MPVMKLYHHGLTAGVPPTMNNHLRAKRGDVGGWSASSTRSNTRFLYSVRENDLTGHGLALTLTLKHCPVDHEEWHRMRRAFFERLRRMGMIRAHWVTEWQRRGVPHLHCAVWFPNHTFIEAYTRATDHWCVVARDCGAGLRGQYALPISDSVGWFKYLSKHASRGVSHYQRNPENIPQGWKKTGRMWGYLGDWPTDDAMQMSVSGAAFYAFRRIVRARTIAEARASGDRRRLRYVRGMLTCHDKALSSVRGVSEWIPLDTQLQILAYLASMGHEVEQVG